MIIRLKLLSFLVALLLSISFIHNASAYYSIIDVIPVGDSPQGVAVNSMTNRIYVANLKDNNVSVIDGDSNTVISTIPVGIYPRSIGINANTNRIYVTTQVSKSVYVIDGVSNTVITVIAIGNGPAGIGVNSNTNVIYAANDPDNTVSVIDGTSNTVISTVSVGSWPRPIGVNPITNRVYVGNANSNTVSVIDGSINVVIDTIGVGPWPGGVCVNRATNLIYVTSILGDDVSVIDGAINSVVTTIPAGESPKGVTVDPTMNLIYVTLGVLEVEGALSIIDGSNNTVIDTIPVDTLLPGGIDVNTQTKRIYATSGDNVVLVLANEIDVEIDIKPGSYPNSINLKSRGKIPVAILTNDDFDAQYVDPETCVFAGAEPLRWNMIDLGRDGDVDMILHFKTQELNLDQNSTEASLVCKNYGGTQIVGTDSVNIVPKGNMHSKKAKKK